MSGINPIRIRAAATPIALTALLLSNLFAMAAHAAPRLKPRSTSAPSAISQSAQNKEKYSQESIDSLKDGVPEGSDTLTIPIKRIDNELMRRPGRLQPNLAPEYLATTLPVEVEPNGTAATATPILGTSVRIRGNVFPNADMDFYSFSATAGDRVYAATMTSFSASASVDSVLDLIGTDGTTVIETDNDDGSFGTTSSSIAGATIPSTGTFFLRVRHNSATAQLRPYELYFQLRTGAPTAETEVNDTFPGQPLPMGGWVSGSTSGTTDVDFFSVMLNAGDTLFLSLDLDPERDTVEWNGQLGLGAFGTPPSTLVVNDAGTSTPDSEAYFMTVQAAGTYGIFVGLPTGGTTFGTYHLSATVFPRVSPGTCTTYTSTNVPVAIPTGPAIVTSTLTVPGNPRIAKLRVNIDLTHNFMADLDVELTSPNGTTIGLFSDVGSVTAGSQTSMQTTLDDDAGVPIGQFTVVQGPSFKPELNYRLGWMDGTDAGGTWTLTIRDDAPGDGGTLNSWSLEICEDPQPLCGGSTPTTVFATDFESGAAGFTHTGTQDEWELGTPTFAPVTGANSGVNCWKTDLDNTYNASSTQDLFSPTITLPAVGPIRLTWAQKYQVESASFDHYFVEVREVGGGGLTRRLFEHLEATMTNTVGNPTVTVQEASGWSIYERDISDFAGLDVQIVFHVDSDTTVQMAGVAIDDVMVQACATACVLTCPADVTASNDAGQCGAVVTYSAPMTTGNCGTIQCVPPSGSFYPVGMTTVTCTDLEDTSPEGTMPASCSFTVTVNDAEPPTIMCSNITQGNDAGQCGAVVTFAPTVTDNCPGVGTVCSPMSGSFFPVGTTSVTCTATDVASNMASCTFSVTVNDTEPPAITCPANIVTMGTAVPGSCGFTAVVTYTTPTPTDNCPGATATCVPASGSTFAEGVTTVTCTATDGASNTAMCTFTVTVGSAFTFCAFDDATGDSFSIVTDPASASYGAWRYHIVATNTTICGNANYVSHIPGVKLRAYDNNYSPENPTYFMDATFGPTSGTVVVKRKNGTILATLRDRNLLNNPPCN